MSTTTTIALDNFETSSSSAQQVKINFYSTPLNAFLSNCVYDSKCKCISITKYNFMHNVPHVVHNLDGGEDRMFAVNQISICQASHSTAIVQNDAEMVIECLEVNDPKNATYVIIPLSYSQWTNRNELDSLIDYLRAQNSAIADPNGPHYPSQALPARLNVNRLLSEGMPQYGDGGGGGTSKGSAQIQAFVYKAQNAVSTLLTGQPVTGNSWCIFLTSGIPLDPYWCQTNTSFLRSSASFNTLYGIQPNALSTSNTPAIAKGQKNIPVATADTIASDKVYIDCTPDGDAGEDGPLDGGLARMQQANLFKLTSADVMVLCQSALVGFTWVIFWYTLNNIFGRDGGVSEDGGGGVNKIRETCCKIADMLKRTPGSDDPRKGMTIGTGVHMALLISTFIVFICAFQYASSKLFLASVHMLNTFFGLWYCSTLDLFNNC